MAEGGPLGADGGPLPIGLERVFAFSGSPNGVESLSLRVIILYERFCFIMVTFF